jgi:hypothetical protein
MYLQSYWHSQKLDLSRHHEYSAQESACLMYVQSHWHSQELNLSSHDENSVQEIENFGSQGVGFGELQVFWK